MTTTSLRSILGVSFLLAGVACTGETTQSGVDAASHDASSGSDASGTDAASEGPDASGTDAAPTDAATVGDGGGEYAGSFIRRTCGPADGPAFQLDLFDRSVAACTVDESRRTLGFYVHDLGGASLPPTAGATITSTPASSSGTANRCTGGACESTETWTLTFETYVDATGATGTYSVTWEDGSTSTGQFDAGWCGDRPLCG